LDRIGFFFVFYCTTIEFNGENTISRKKKKYINKKSCRFFLPPFVPSPLATPPENSNPRKYKRATLPLLRGSRPTAAESKKKKNKNKKGRRNVIVKPFVKPFQGCRGPRRNNRTWTPRVPVQRLCIKGKVVLSSLTYMLSIYTYKSKTMALATFGRDVAVAVAYKVILLCIIRNTMEVGDERRTNVFVWININNI